MKKLPKLFKKNVIVALLCLTITNAIGMSWFTDANIVNTCSNEETEPNAETNPFDIPGYK